jgi:hypothetical protein
MDFFVASPSSLSNSLIEGFQTRTTNVTTSVESANSSEPNKELLRQYRTILSTLKSDSHLLNIQQIELDKLEKVKDLAALRGILWSVLTSVYTYNSELLDSQLEEMENIENEIKEQKKIAQRDKDIMNKLKGLNLTNKRKVTIENYTFEKTDNQVSFFKGVLIVLAVLFILPILRLLKIIGKGLALTLFGITIVVLALYGVYELYYKSLNRDEYDFNKYNFGKPSDEQIMASRVNSRKSSGDLQRCADLQEVEGEDIDLDSLVIPQDKLDEWMSDTCQLPQSDENTSTGTTASRTTASRTTPVVTTRV